MFVDFWTQSNNFQQMNFGWATCLLPRPENLVSLYHQTEMESVLTYFTCWHNSAGVAGVDERNRIIIIVNRHMKSLPDKRRGGRHTFTNLSPAAAAPPSPLYQPIWMLLFYVGNYVFWIQIISIIMELVFQDLHPSIHLFLSLVL